MTVAKESPADPKRNGLLFVGGKPRANSPLQADALRRCHEALGRFLQIKNLAVLVGAGASLHLGSPKIRNLRAEEVIALVAGGTALPPEEKGLLERLASSAVDLEQLLSILTTGLAFGRGVGAAALPVGDSTFQLDVMGRLRKRLNRALGMACDLPGSRGVDENEAADPLRAHREFFRRLLRSRRGDLPRVRVFTTNYDLLIEKALDESGVAYLDGFTGTVSRVFRPEVYDQDIYVQLEESPRSTRLPDMLYLYKLHGSINWKSKPSPATLGSAVVVQKPDWTADEDLLMIYPTPQKDSDVLGYPYAELFKTFASIVNASETGLLVVGYGFSDDHLNRLIFQALAAVPTFQLLVIDPLAVHPKTDVSEGSDGQDYEVSSAMAGRLAGWSDARISVLAGAWARFVTFATEVMPDPDDAGDVEQSLGRRMEELRRLVDTSGSGSHVQ